MIELELLGSHGDGSQLVFTDANGERYLVTIDDALRAAIRREEIQVEVPQGKTDLSPKEIQELLRAGMTPPEIASAFEMEIARINRFVPPILSERAFIVSSALATNVGAELDAPKLEDVVIDRLATRGVDPTSLVWSATRKRNHPWQLHLTFVQAARTLSASWEIDPSGRLQRALDEQARWLTETLTSAAEQVGGQEDLGTSPATYAAPGEPENAAEVEKLLDDLVAARGKRSSEPARSDFPDLAAERIPVLHLPEGAAEAPSLTGGRSAEVIDFSARASHAEKTVPPVRVPAVPAGAANTVPADVAGSLSAAPGAAPAANGEDSTVAPGEAAGTLQAAGELQAAGKLQAAPTLASDDDVQSLPGLDHFAGEDKPKKASSKRRSVPTWDEIIFGAKND